jgi:alginate lyase
MALARIGDVNATTSSTTTTTATNAPNAHASSIEGDFVFIPVVSKPSGSAVGTPSGYTAGTQTALGSGTSAESAGLQRIGAFWRVLPASPTISPVASLSLVATGSVLSAGAITYRPDAGWIVEVTESSGSDTSSGTGVAISGGTVLPFLPEDWLILCLAVPNSAVAAAGLDALNGSNPSIAGATFNNLDSKWNTSGNGGTAGFSQRTISLDAKCTAGLATAVPSLAVTTDLAVTAGAKWWRLHPVHLPRHMLNLGTGSGNNFFKLQYATDGAGSVSEQTLAQLVAGFYLDQIFYPIVDSNGDQEWLRFRVRCDGPNTGGTSYARTELREETSAGGDKSFNSASGRHVMRVRERWMEYGTVKPTIVGAQVHDGSADQWQLCTQKNATSGLVEIKSRIDGTSSGQPTPVLNYQLGDVVDSIIDINAGTTMIYINDMVNALQRTTAVDGSTLFFKAGCYLNFDETDEASTQHGAVDIFQDSLQVWHTGDAGSPPAPLQLDQPNALMVAC